MNNKIIAILFTLFAGLSFFAAAGTTAYKCTKEDGSVSFLDHKPLSGCVDIVEINPHVGKGSSGDPDNPEDLSNLSEEDQKVITISTG